MSAVSQRDGDERVLGPGAELAVEAEQRTKLMRERFDTRPLYGTVSVFRAVSGAGIPGPVV